MTEKELVVRTTEENKENDDLINKGLIDTLTINNIPNKAKDWFLREPSNPCSFCESIQRKCNLCGLYNIGPKCHVKCARITVSDLCLFLLFAVWVILPIMASFEDYASDDDSDSDRLLVISRCFGGAAGRQFMLALLFTQRNTIMRFIFGLPFERAVGYHETMASVGAVFVWVHGISIIVYWSGKKDVTVGEELGKHPGLFGLLAYCCFFLGGVLAHESNRRKCFEAFMKSHWIFMTLFVIMVIIHIPPNGKILFFIILALQIIDIIYRQCINFGKPAKVKKIEYLEANDVVKIVFNKKNFKFSAGQYVFLAIPSISRSQFHPFSISCSSNEDDNKGDFTLHIKCVGDFVETLREAVKNGDITAKSMQIFVEGPYGRPAIPALEYSSIILISGGIGITPMISIFAELIDNIKMTTASNNYRSTDKDIKQELSTKRVHFVWTVKTPDMIEEFDIILKKILLKYTKYEKNNIDDIELKEEINLNGILIKISYYVTRVKDEDEQHGAKQIYNNLTFTRPDVKVIINEAKESKGSDCIGIMACGPMKMLESVQNESALAGIHCHTEVFNI